MNRNYVPLLLLLQFDDLLFGMLFKVDVLNAICHVVQVKWWFLLNILSVRFMSVFNYNFQQICFILSCWLDTLSDTRIDSEMYIYFKPFKAIEWIHWGGSQITNQYSW